MVMLLKLKYIKRLVIGNDLHFGSFINNVNRVLKTPLEDIIETQRMLFKIIVQIRCRLIHFMITGQEEMMNIYHNPRGAKFFLAAVLFSIPLFFSEGVRTKGSLKR